MFGLQLLSLLFRFLMFFRADQAPPQFSKDFSFPLAYGLLGDAESTGDFSLGAAFPEQALKKPTVCLRQVGQGSLEQLFLLLDREAILRSGDGDGVIGSGHAVTQRVRPLFAIARRALARIVW